MTHKVSVSDGFIVLQIKSREFIKPKILSKENYFLNSQQCSALIVIFILNEVDDSFSCFKAQLCIYVVRL
jgi:hypothetical protein